MESLSKARTLLESGNYTCVVCKEDSVYTTTQRGVAPLLNWLDTGTDLSGFSAARISRYSRITWILNI